MGKSTINGSCGSCSAMFDYRRITRCQDQFFFSYHNLLRQTPSWASTLAGNKGKNAPIIKLGGTLHAWFAPQRHQISCSLEGRSTHRRTKPPCRFQGDTGQQPRDETCRQMTGSNGPPACRWWGFLSKHPKGDTDPEANCWWKGQSSSRPCFAAQDRSAQTLARDSRNCWALRSAKHWKDHSVHRINRGSPSRWSKTRKTCLLAAEFFWVLCRSANTYTLSLQWWSSGLQHMASYPSVCGQLHKCCTNQRRPRICTNRPVQETLQYCRDGFVVVLRSRASTNTRLWWLWVCWKCRLQLQLPNRWSLILALMC